MTEKPKPSGLIIIDFEDTLNRLNAEQLRELFDFQRTQCAIVIVTEHCTQRFVERYLQSNEIDPEQCAKIVPNAFKGIPRLYNGLANEAGVMQHRCIFIDNNPVYASYAFSGGALALLFQEWPGGPKCSVFMKNRKGSTNELASNPANYGPQTPMMSLIDSITSTWQPNTYKPQVPSQSGNGRSVVTAVGVLKAG